MPPRKKIRRVRKVVLLVAEGHTEAAFLSALKEYYACQDYKISINNRRGGSSDTIVKFACDEADGYYSVVAVIDSDVPLSKKYKDMAKRKKVKLIISHPCIEGTLLNILGIRCPDNTVDCKRLFEQNIGNKKTSHNAAHKQLFPRELLEQQRGNVEQLDEIILSIEGHLFF